MSVFQHTLGFALVIVWKVLSCGSGHHGDLALVVMVVSNRLKYRLLVLQ